MIDNHSLADQTNWSAAVHLLNLRTPLPVRARGMGSIGVNNFARCLLFELTKAHAVIKPPKHNKKEIVPLERVHLWPSAICSGVSPVCSIEQYKKLFPTEEKPMSALQLDDDLLARFVIMDKGYRQYYLGSDPSASKNRNPFTIDLAAAKHYEESEKGGANMSIGWLKKGARTNAMISDTGLEVISIKDALQYIREHDGQDKLLSQQQSLNLTIGETDEDRKEAELAAKESLRAAGIKPAYPEKMTNPVPQYNGNGKSHTNGHTNGHANGHSRFGNFLPSPVQYQPIGISSLGLDVTTDTANIPSIDEAENRLLAARKNIAEATQMLLDAQKEEEEALRTFILSSKLHSTRAVDAIKSVILEVAATIKQPATEPEPTAV